MLVDSVRLFLEDLLTNEPEYFIVDIKYFGNNASNKKLSVIIDGNDGINIDKCVSISRKLSNWMEQEDMINTAYQLEGTSPRVGFPLTQIRQYNKIGGKKIQLKTLDGNVFLGILQGVTNDFISIEMPNKKYKKYNKNTKWKNVTGVEIKNKDLNTDISLKLIKSGKVILDF